MKSGSIDDFERRLGHGFSRRELLLAAWTHRSGAHEAGLDMDYERLEFLGDAVLGLVGAEWLYRRYPQRPEGDLARIKSRLVSADALAAYARALDLGPHLVLGQGEERSGGREKTSLLADSMEAVLGAVYLDGGLGAARRVIHRFVDFVSESFDIDATDAKNALQEALQTRGLAPPDYVVVDEKGPDHEKTFSVEVRIEGRVAGRGKGRTKKAAERAAARQALSSSKRRSGRAASVE